MTKDKEIKENKSDSKVSTSKDTSSKATEKAKASPKKSKEPIKLTSIKPIPQDNSYGTGKRKTAIAKVWIFKGKGEYIVNKKRFDDYLSSERFLSNSIEPLKLLGLENNYDVRVSALGGGLSAQADAISLGIARALVSMDENFRDKLKGEFLLRRDDRIKERKKYGRKRARKSFTYRKR